MKVDKDYSTRQLQELLIERGNLSPGYIRRKLFFWRFTIAGANLIKRTLDIFLSLLFLVFFSPLIALTATAIYLTSPGPIIFRQIRVGRNGRQFVFYKFRSMRTGAEKLKNELKNANESADGVIFKIKRDPRTTAVGRFIRKYSIDELPQLFNVLRGDMSMVGPRPPLPEEVAEYSLEERKRLHITPGLTCLWQISGRSNLPFTRQVELDKEYISNHSIWKDFIILLKTIPAVITGRGAY